MGRIHIAGPLTTRAHRSKLRQLIDRDGWVCWVCRDPIDSEAPPNDPGQVSIDHVLPRRLGGRHGLSNLKLAHKLCNERRDPWFGGEGVARAA
jgi:5-methylcytosine-specific restriction endonuclease McrA